MKTIKIIMLIFAIVLLYGKDSLAQNRFDALRYNQVDPGNDPVSLSMGGASVANTTGFGSFVQNPATAALYNNSFFSFSINSRNVNETSDYLNTSKKFNDTQTAIGNLGAVIKVPTVQGVLVLGGGYSQTANFNRAVSIKAFNSQNSITDAFNNSSFYWEPAYYGYALDSTATGTEPVLRLAGFQGINQYAEQKERGQMGEYALFGATEFQKNLYVGLSLNFPVGHYTYYRSFLESDPNNLYNTPPYDVNTIDSEDHISADISGFYGRIGFVYKVMPWLNIAASYRTRATLSVSEQYSSSVQTTFKTPDSNGNTSYKGTLQPPVQGDKYKVINPGRLVLGASIADYNGLTVNFSSEYIPYSNIQMEGISTVQRENQNSLISSEFKNVWNLMVGAGYKIGNIEPRVGYAFYPSPRKNYDASRTYYTAGIGVGLNNSFKINIGAAYSTWKDNLIMYTNAPTTTENVHRLNAMIGFQMTF